MTRQIVLNTDRLFVHHSVSNASSDQYDLHCHNDAEVFFFISGNVQYLVEGCEYHPVPMSMLLISPGVFHGVKVLTNESYDRYALHFLPELLSDDLREPLLRPFSQGGGYYALCGGFDFPGYFDAVLACRTLPEPLRAAAVRPRTESLLIQVSAMTASPAASPSAETADQAVREVIDYVNREFQRPLSLDELSERFYISKNHLNRVFRNATGTTVFNYICHKRVALARRLILSGMTAQEAASRAGFGDYSSFFSQYRKILGHSPVRAKQHAIL